MESPTSQPPPTHPNAAVIERLYAALRKGDAQAAADCYNPDAHFHDIAFWLDGRRNIHDMWRMVCHGGVKVVEHRVISADENEGRGFWEAHYDFGILKRPVISKLSSTFKFRDGLITSHVDDMDPQVWADQAFPKPISRLVGTNESVRRKLAASKLFLFRLIHGRAPE